VVKLDKAGDFVGRAALEAAKDRPRKALVGMRITGRGIARTGYPVYLPAAPEPCGVVTSGTASPTLGFPIAMGYVPCDQNVTGSAFEVGIRTQRATAEVVPLPFYRRPA
jgi:aminomethyltransferase